MDGISQLGLFNDPHFVCNDGAKAIPASSVLRGNDTPVLEDYARVVCFFSGGKDSIATVLHLLECGVPSSKIELHHHIVDGREGSVLMDWPCTEAYCEAFARAFGLKLFFSWKVGGFEREMLRNGERTAPIAFEQLGGGIAIRGGDGGTLGTRRKFPQVTADLRTRWCSSYLKCDVGARIITSEPRFLDGKTLVITGERAQESAARARYKQFEPHRADNRNGARVNRHVDAYRSIHGWVEEEVWEILKRYRVNPHPAYWLGWGRTSCRTCIFGSANQWATVKAFFPEAFERVARYEEEFGVTIHRTKSVRELAAIGTPYACDMRMVDIASRTTYDEAILVEGEWKLPPGAFGEGCGPT